MTAPGRAYLGGSLLTVISKQETHFNSTLTTKVICRRDPLRWQHQCEDFRKHLPLIRSQTSQRHRVHVLRSGSGLRSGVGVVSVSQCIWRERACPRGCQLALGECESVRDHHSGIHSQWWCPDHPRPTPLQYTRHTTTAHPSTPCPCVLSLPTPHPCPLFLPPALALPTLVLPECGAALSAV